MHTDETTPETSSLDPDGYALIGACFEVYNTLGSGFLEEVYQESLEIELGLRAIPYIAKPRLKLSYKGRALRKEYEADLLIHDTLVVELKAAKAFAPEHEAQLINYLKATGKRIGYLVNFGAFPRLDWRRRAV